MYNDEESMSGESENERGSKKKEQGNVGKQNVEVCNKLASLPSGGGVVPVERNITEPQFNIISLHSDKNLSPGKAVDTTGIEPLPRLSIVVNPR